MDWQIFSTFFRYVATFKDNCIIKFGNIFDPKTHLYYHSRPLINITSTSDYKYYATSNDKEREDYENSESIEDAAARELVYSSNCAAICEKNR